MHQCHPPGPLDGKYDRPRATEGEVDEPVHPASPVWRRPHRLAALGAAAAATVLIAGAGLAYLVLAVRAQPLALAFSSVGPCEESVGKQPLHQGLPPTTRADACRATYVDGGGVTLLLWVLNTGRLGATVTGVDTSAEDSHDLLMISAAKQPVFRGPSPCCIVDEVATWNAAGFPPEQVDPGGEAVIAVRLMMGNCEFTRPGSVGELESVAIDYDVLGSHHRTELNVPLVTVASPALCPRERRIP